MEQTIRNLKVNRDGILKQHTQKYKAKCKKSQTCEEGGEHLRISF